MAARLLAARGRSGAHAEAVLRVAPTYSIAVHWVSILDEHGIAARCASDPVSSFMGDSINHRVIVRSDRAAEAARVLDALWPEGPAQHSGRR